MFEADRTLGSNRWALIRLAAGSRTEVVLLSSRFFSLTTHWNKCTVPCCGDDCRLCEVLPSRGLFYVAVTSQSRISILELASQSSSLFEQGVKFSPGGFAAGQVVELSRRAGKLPVRSEVVRFQPGVAEVSHYDLVRHVMAIYKYPCPNPAEDLASYEIRCAGIARVRCNRVADLVCSSQVRQVR